MENSENLLSDVMDVSIAPEPRAARLTNHIQPADGEEKTCSTCAAKSSGAVQYVYALGKIQSRFPSLGVEKEFMQVVGGEKTNNLSDKEVMVKILTDTKYVYLARKLCWTLSIEGLETYLLQPMNPADINILINSLNFEMNLVIGLLGPIASASYCNGLQLPFVGFDQIYSFDVTDLIGSIPKLGKATPKVHSSISNELFTRIMQMTDNAGATDDHRALNYLAVRYPGIYTVAADSYSRNYSLTGVEARPSALNGARKMVDVIFTFSNRATDVSEKYYCRVDVTEEFPFLVTKMQVYIDR